MAFTARERFFSRPRRIHRDDEGYELHYNLLADEFEIDGDDDDAAFDALDAGAPETYKGAFRDSLEIEQKGPGTWLGIVRYSGDPRDESSGWDTTGGTVHITHAPLVQSSNNTLATNAPDFQGAINVKDGRVEGIDIPAPSLKFHETRFFAASEVDTAYRKLVASMSGSSNNAPFLGFDAGELLFLGAKGTQRKQGADWEIQFEFDTQMNLEDLNFNLVDLLDKQGWDYLWLFYEDAEDANAKMIVNTARAGYVHRPIARLNFSLLGL